MNLEETDIQTPADKQSNRKHEYKCKHKLSLTDTDAYAQTCPQ